MKKENSINVQGNVHISRLDENAKGHNDIYDNCGVSVGKKPQEDAIQAFFSKNYFESFAKFREMEDDFEVSLNRALEQARDECIREQCKAECEKFVNGISAVPKDSRPSKSEHKKTYEYYVEGKHIVNQIELRWTQMVVEDNKTLSMETVNFKMSIQDFWALHKNDLRFCITAVDDVYIRLLEKKRQLWEIEKAKLIKNGFTRWQTALLKKVVFPKTGKWLAANGMTWETFQDLFCDSEISKDAYYRANRKYRG